MDFYLKLMGRYRSVGNHLAMLGTTHEAPRSRSPFADSVYPNPNPAERGDAYTDGRGLSAAVEGREGMTMKAFFCPVNPDSV
jgi:hypothetical protein